MWHGQIWNRLSNVQNLDNADNANALFGRDASNQNYLFINHDQIDSTPGSMSNGKNRYSTVGRVEREKLRWNSCCVDVDNEIGLQLLMLIVCHFRIGHWPLTRILIYYYFRFNRMPSVHLFCVSIHLQWQSEPACACVCWVRIKTTNFIILNWFEEKYYWQL